MSEVAAVPTAVEPAKSIWTKEMQAAAKVSARVVFRFMPRPEGAKSWDPQPVQVEFIREEQKEEGKPYRPEQRLVFIVDGFIRHGYGEEVRVSHHAEYGEMHVYQERSYRPTEGAWQFSLYHRDPGSSETVLALLPVGAEVKFEIALDHHTNGYVTKARLHGDVLIATFKKGKQKGSLEIDHSIVPMNSARFGYRIGR